MRKILKSYNLDKKEAYNVLNMNPERLANHIGETFEVAGYAVTVTEDDQTGEKSYGFTFKTPDGEYLGTGGKAFVEGILTFLECFEPSELNKVTVGSKSSRQGREYLVFIA